MSDVRLSNASPTVERVDARQLDNARSVRRVLFGTPDPEETRKQAEALQLQSVEAFRDKYNFDPVEDRPLSPGLYDWQEDEDAPEFYRRPPRWSQPPRGEAGEGSRETRRERRSPHTKGSRKRSFQSFFSPPPHLPMLSCSVLCVNARVVVSRISESPAPFPLRPTER
uniref:Cyclin-dependent kinase inhibitor 1B n=1 Tax=Poecilia mexicana TaxID=48701 RepID=A0A3B3XWR1_9TELE